MIFGHSANGVLSTGILNLCHWEFGEWLHIIYIYVYIYIYIYISSLCLLGIY